MISHEDFKFHTRDPKDRTWTETLFLIFAIPEEAISGSIYTLTRPNMGVCHSAIEIHQGLCFQPWQIQHADAQMHLPCPADFSDYGLENGLTFKALNARDSRFTYKSLDGNCAFDLTYKAICDPLDSNDPEDNPPLVKADSAKMSGYGGWNNGHMESIGRTTGALTLRGKTYRVDCIEGMNKSWGPRNDWGSKGATWVHVNLGDDVSAFLIFEIEFEGKEAVYRPFKYGFLAEGGKRRQLVAASLKAQRSDLCVTRAIIQFTDDQGKSYEAVGTTIAGSPWYQFNPASAAFQVLMRFECNGQVGYSHIADFAGLNYMARGMAETFAP